MTSSLQTGVGESGGQESEKTPCRITAEVEGMREELLAQICSIIGRNLTLAEIQALKDNPRAMEHLQFEVDKVLAKVASWKLK